jgi:hypothetical protein
MANCAVHPEPFTPPAMVLEDGGPLRRARCVVYIRGGFPKTLEDCVIAIINGQLSTLQRYALMHISATTLLQKPSSKCGTLLYIPPWCGHLLFEVFLSEGDSYLAQPPLC